MLLDGKQIKISMPSLRKYEGKKVKILLKRDIDNRHGTIHPFLSIIESVVRKNIITPCDSYYFSEISEIVEAE